MGLSANNNLEKSELEDRVKRKQFEMQEEASNLARQSDKMIKNALIIGGALVLTFFVVRSLTGKSSKKIEKKESAPSDPEASSSQPSMIAGIGSRIAEGAVIFLLGLAKEQLSEYLKSRRKENEYSQ